MNLHYDEHIDYLDEKQKDIHNHFPADSRLSNPQYVKNVILWATFYRRNIHRFVIDYLHIDLYPYQIYMLYFLHTRKESCILAARSAAKTFCIAIYACARALLYPNSEIVIASATKDMSKSIIVDKIQGILQRRYKVLDDNIEKINTSPANTSCVFKNGSIIRVVPVTAVGGRCNYLIIEEAGRMKKQLLKRNIMPYCIKRQVPFMSDPFYADNDELNEDIRETVTYISSSQMRSHWLIQDVVLNLNKKMKAGQDAFLMCLDYAIALKHNIKSRQFMENEKNSCDPITFATEYENLAPSQSRTAFYTYEMVNKVQTLKLPFYPRITEDYIANIKNRHSIPRQQGEIRIISADIAMMDNDRNDKSAYSCMRLIPTVPKTSYDGRVSQEFHIQVPYLEALAGQSDFLQAIRIRQLYDDFDADYIVLDMRTYGIPIYDELTKILYDEERGVEYKPFTMMNQECLDESRKPVNPNANPVIYGFVGNPKKNSEMIINLRSYLSAEKIELLVPKNESKQIIDKYVPKYKHFSVETQLFLDKPFLETMFLVNELIKLEYEKSEGTGYIKVYEQSGMCKDRFSSLGMGCYFADMLARDMLRQEEITIEQATLCVSHINF